MAPDGSFYTMPREMRGAFKISLHPPNAENATPGWFFGFTRDAAAQFDIKPPGHPRLERFTPSEMAPGLIRVATVVIHESVVNETRTLVGATKHLWIPKPPPDHAVEVVHIFCTDLGMRFDLASKVFELQNAVGARIVALHRVVPAVKRIRMSGEFPSQEDYSSVRAVAVGLHKTDGSLVCEEFTAEPGDSLPSNPPG